MIYPVILSGGAGSRLWPLSRSLYPKQLLSLMGENSLIQDTALRVRGSAFFDPIVICNLEHRFLISEQLRKAGVIPEAIVLEPVGRNTAPAAGIAALMVAKKDPDGLLLLMPADHVISNHGAFLKALSQAQAAAKKDYLVTFGITPDAPETGYGYIKRGATLAGLVGSYGVDRFVEKPDAQTAANYIADGSYSWNSGLFLFKASAFLDELERLEPQMLEGCRAAIAKGRQDLDFFRLESESFAKIKSVSIDYAIMEKTHKAAIVPASMGWSDIGSWDQLWSATAHDESGNTIKGDVITNNTHDCYVQSQGPLVATVGLKDMIVVATSDAVLVSHKNTSQDVKKIVETLDKEGREIRNSHRKVFRPWGAYESVDSGRNFQVKRITVNVGAKISLQMHHKRAEHWIVVSGTARVTCDDKITTLTENQSTYIPLGAKHRLENIGQQPLELIEVQSGSYLGEDDIVRFEDSYGRS